MNSKAAEDQMKQAIDTKQEELFLQMEDSNMQSLQVFT